MKFILKGLPFTSRALFTIVGGAVLINPAFAQDQTNEEIEEVVVTGIRGSLKASMNMKREAIGVVDAINAEDIGKFPDTNLAESLQRITGVSIDRVNGEGSRVTARGFGPGFNLVTLNGRAMPTADVVVVGSGGDGEYNNFTSRSFDLSNIASEGVSGIEVYKTGRAAVPSGGIGATINIKTLRPLEEPGFRASFGVKGMVDTSVETGDSVTPEASGLFSWTSDSERLGVAFFGSFSKRDSAAVGASNQDWNVERLDRFLDTSIATGTGRVRADNPATPANEATVFNGLNQGLIDRNPLVIYPNNSDYFFSEVERERKNGQLTVQFAPSDSLTLTVDALYVENEQQEMRSTQGNWFNRPFAEVTFDDDPTVTSVTFLRESLNSPKDIAWGQQLRATRDVLSSFGFNADLAVSDKFKLNFDAHSSLGRSVPNGPGGFTSFDFGTGAAAIGAHSLDLSGGFPVQNFIYNDNDGPNPCNTFTRQYCRNDNGIIDIADVSSSVGRVSVHKQAHEIQEFRLEGEFSINDSSQFSAGADYRTTEMRQRRVTTAQILGDWGVIRPGDVEIFAPGVLEAYCLSCLYDDFNPGLGTTAFRGNAAQLIQAHSPYYQQIIGNPIQTWNNDTNQVDEDITSVYAQYAWKGEIGGRASNLVAGVRYEETDVTSTAALAPVTNVIWTGDNDFATATAPPGTNQVEEASYSNVLPALDFSIEVVDNVMVRAGYSKTIARADYGQLFVANTAGTPPRATALGGVATGNLGNPSLIPLESENFDLSLELYYKDDSYISLGFFNKNVENFVGTTQTLMPLFGLRDPSSGAAGSRSGTASTLIAGIPGALRNDVNLFVMTALVSNPGLYANPRQYFLDRMNGAGEFNQAQADAIFALHDIIPNDQDPEMQFLVSQPNNQRDANIHGAEIAIQHFFGDSGFGFAANYTVVDGDVAINVAGDPSTDQFALVGLSDTANGTLIFEKFGLSARLSYNWRDRFLQTTQRGGFRNPEFVSPFEQYDLNVGYDINDNLSVSFEAINILGENNRTYGRSQDDYWFVQDLHPRYLLGARYKFK